MSEPVREVCPKCGGLGVVTDQDWEFATIFHVHWEVCTRCMEAGFVPSRSRVWERCPICRGEGRHFDPDIAEGWPFADPWHRCEDCSGLGERARKLTLREKVVGFLRLTWPPDVENPAHFPGPERAMYERRERDRKREASGVKL